MNTIPKEIIEGYPKKAYTFTGEWVETQDGGRNTARRNRKAYLVPVYKSKNGERILYMPFKKLNI